MSCLHLFQFVHDKGLIFFMRDQWIHFFSEAVIKFHVSGDIPCIKERCPGPDILKSFFDAFLSSSEGMADLQPGIP